MDEVLQGTKGEISYYTDNVGKVTDTVSKKDPGAGNDVYLTIDKDLQEQTYKLLEEKLAGIVRSKLRNVMNYDPSTTNDSSEIIIPVDDAYNAFIANEILDETHFGAADAKAVEKTVYEIFTNRKASVIQEILAELNNAGATAYKDLSKEMQAYMDYVCDTVLAKNTGILNMDLVDTKDETYLAWAKEETINLNQYLNYAISKNWIDTSKLSEEVAEQKYSDSGEIYQGILKFLEEYLNYIEKNNIENQIIYILGCSIGPFLKVFIERLKKLNVKLFINPDGLEHKRLKWNCYIRKYLKYSERVMVKYADLVICDSLNIEKYIKEEYKKYKPKTEFIAYGAEIKSNPSENNEKLNKWYKEKGIKKGQYYVSVGRFVPENNYETMIKEFMKSNTKKDFVIITNYEKNKFYQQLNVSTNFQKDKRIKFVGTVYDQELLTKIRENAYGYIHGHEVGGTNPSLLEALATTKLNLLLGVGFNKEVAETAGIYWTKGNGSLSRLIDNTDYLPINTIYEYSKKSKDRIKNYYNWPMITLQYEKLFEDTSLLFRTPAI